MIERVWRGWIAPGKADEYQRFLQVDFLPAAHAIPGYRGARVLRRNVGDEVEFMTITRFDSREAIRAFAGDDPERAHVAPEARALLTRWDERVAHYDIAFDDEVASGEAGGELPAETPARTDVKLRTASSGAVSVGALAAGTAAFGAAALGAVAVGAFAIGALAVGRISIGKARIRRLEIDDLMVGKLTETNPASGAEPGGGLLASARARHLVEEVDIAHCCLVEPGDRRVAAFDDREFVGRGWRGRQPPESVAAHAGPIG